MFWYSNFKKCNSDFLLSGWRSYGICGVSVPAVHLLPHHRPADAEEIPQVAEDSAIKGVLLVSTVLQVRDPVTWHELPGGAVDGDKVEVAAQQQNHHHRENTNDTKHRQQEPIDSEPQLPCDGGWDARPERYALVLRTNTTRRNVFFFWIRHIRKYQEGREQESKLSEDKLLDSLYNMPHSRSSPSH